MTFQEIAVYVIVFAAIAYTIYKIISAFTSKSTTSGCSHCMGSCEVKHNSKRVKTIQK